MKAETNWQERYLKEDTGWDIGSISTPLKAYFDQLTDKDLKILIPGGGNGYEAAYLYEQGFKNVFLLDFAPKAIENFKSRNPSFPEEHLIESNFFEHSGQYNLIVEQTFFCAINPSLRTTYAKKTAELLAPKGKLVGLFWSQAMNNVHPPFGGNKEEYLGYFNPYYYILTFETAHNSIKPRAGTELFLIAQGLQ